MTKIKQVIVVRTDLINTDGESIGAGKLMSQAAHAAHNSYQELIKYYPMKSYEITTGWIDNGEKVAVLEVHSQEELLEIAKHAGDTGIPHTLIRDNGITEFGNVMTDVCVGIGPYFTEEIDKITGHLKRFK